MENWFERLEKSWVYYPVSDVERLKLAELFDSMGISHHVPGSPTILFSPNEDRIVIDAYDFRHDTDRMRLYIYFNLRSKRVRFNEVYFDDIISCQSVDDLFALCEYK